MSAIDSSASLEDRPAPEARNVTACLLIIGNEILSGRTQDANLAFLGTALNEMGIRLMEARVVPDIEETIVATLNEVRSRFDYVFTTGGIGPTHDDITSACVAKAFGRRWSLNQEAKAILEAHYPPGMLNEARLRMAHTPEGASLIENPISKAPGFRVDNVFVLAGIPKIMQAQFGSLRHDLTGGAPLLSRSLEILIGEGTVARELGVLQERYPDVEFGSYPFQRDGHYGTRLVIRSADPDLLERAAQALEAMVATHDTQGKWDA